MFALAVQHLLSSAVIIFVLIHGAPAYSNPNGSENSPFIDLGHGRLAELIGVFASDDANGREMGTPEGIRARTYVKNLVESWAEKSGNGDRIKISSQIFSTETFKGPRSGENIFVLINSGQGDPSLILSAHYDHLDDHCVQVRSKSAYCNGAADNASSVSILLSLIPDLIKSGRSIALAFWDGEEHGLRGSKHFVSSEPRPFSLDEVKLLINLDIVGLDVFPGLESSTFLLAAETGGDRLLEVSRKAFRNAQLHPVELTAALAMNRSDHQSFLNSSLGIPVLFISDGDGTHYHTSADELENLNLGKIERVRNVVQELAYKTKSIEISFQQPRTLPKPIQWIGKNIFRLKMAMNFYLPTDKDIHAVKWTGERIHENFDKVFRGERQDLKSDLHSLLQAPMWSWNPLSLGKLMRLAGVIRTISRERFGYEKAWKNFRETKDRKRRSFVRSK